MRVRVRVWVRVRVKVRVRVGVGDGVGVKVSSGCVRTVLVRLVSRRRRRVMVPTGA